MKVTVPLEIYNSGAPSRVLRLDRHFSILRDIFNVCGPCGQQHPFILWNPKSTNGFAEALVFFRDAGAAQKFADEVMTAMEAESLNGFAAPLDQVWFAPKIAGLA